MSATMAQWRRFAVTGLLAGGLVAGSALAGMPAQAAPSRNLLGNASAESVVRGTPVGWTKGGAGVNARALTSAVSGAQNGRRYVRAQIKHYRSGGAWWQTPVAAVRPGAAYTLSEYYRANRPVKVNAYYVVGRRTVGVPVGSLAPSGRWKAASFTVRVPAGATRVRFATVLPSAGFVDVDNLALLPSAARGAVPRPATSGPGFVSLTFDDGWTNQHTNAFPVMKSAGMPGTFYLISSYLGSGAYMSVSQAKELQAAGSEIGSHTVSHANLTKADGKTLERELSASKQSLEAKFGPVTSLAYPFGASNAKVQSAAAKYYSSSRSTNAGLNVKGRYNPQSLTIGYVLNTTPLSTVQGWINDAKAKNAWLILCYHRVATDQPNDHYTITPSAFSQQVDAIKKSGIRVVTVKDGLAATR
jgi:peptidoglycan/xylan/chitin deacetylase (PgdA/CDA1 family)